MNTSEKQLFIRFFANAGDTMPRNSNKVFDSTVKQDAQYSAIREQSDEIQYWMEKHPNGKIDFVWLIHGILPNKSMV